MGIDSKIDETNIFEHDEKMISDTMKFLGANAEKFPLSADSENLTQLIKGPEKF